MMGNLSFGGWSYRGVNAFGSPESRVRVKAINRRWARNRADWPSFASLSRYRLGSHVRANRC